MDIVAHALWTNAAFYKKYKIDKKNRYLGAFFGVLPDIVSFAPATIFLLFTNQRFSPALYNSSLWFFRWAEESYNYTHSLVIFVIVMVIIMALRKGKAYWPMFGWLLHILIDIPTHKDFYETPFLFPLSDYHFSYGMAWAEPAFMFVNYGALAVIYIFIFYFKKRQGAKASP